MSIPEYIQAFIQLAKQMDEEHGIYGTITIRRAEGLFQEKSKDFIFEVVAWDYFESGRREWESTGRQ